MTQFQEMRDAGLHLVVPAGLIDSYPESVRPWLISLGDILRSVAALQS